MPPVIHKSSSARTNRVSPLRRSPRRAAAAAPGERVYAIGDIHGRYDLLHPLLKLIDQDNQGRQSSTARIVILGDFIDRGQDSKKVVSLLRAAQEYSVDRFVVLLGNHEAMMLDALSGKEGTQHFWLEHGGYATLASFGIDPPYEGERAEEFAVRAIDGMTGDVLDWVQHLPLTVRSGDYFFCHAGARPGVPLAEQSREDLLWIRREFLQSTHDFGAVVVHGHSARHGQVEFHDHRIGVDTGAYATGILSAVGLEATDKWRLSTGVRQAEI